MSNTHKVRVRSSHYATGEKEVAPYLTEMPDGVAALAIMFLEKWSMVAAMPDGEDSAGRAKLRLPTPEEVVTRAFDIAETAYAIAKSRGRMISLPDLNEINRDYDERTAQREKRETEREPA